MYAPFRNLTVVIALTIGGMSTGFAAADLRIVAENGTEAFGTNGTFGNSGAPVINNLGQTAFWNEASGGAGIWSEENGMLSNIIQAGDEAPGTGVNTAFSHFNNGVSGGARVLFNDEGHVVFNAVLSGTDQGNANNDSLWLGTQSGITLIAHEGTVPFGGSSGFPYDTMSSIRLNNSSHVAFHANSNSSSSLNAIVTGPAGSVAVAIESGDAAGVAGDPGANFSVFGPPVLNNAGTIAFYAELDNNQGGSGNDEAIWTNRTGSLNMIVRENSQAPGMASGVLFKGLSSPSINSAGQTAFNSILKGFETNGSNDASIWSEGSGSLSLIARKSSAAPGFNDSSVFFTQFSFQSPLISTSGDVVFSATVDDFTGTITGSNNSALWAGGSNGLTIVAREGNLASLMPGHDDGALFGNFTVQSNSALGTTAINSEGRVAFLGGLTGTEVNSSNDVGIWAQDANGVLHLIARKGDPIEISPGNFQTILDLRFVGGAGDDDGRSSGFNDLGQVAFYAAWKDQGGPFSNKTGIFVSNLVASSLPGDFDFDGDVDGADFLSWQRGAHSSSDLAAWQTNYGSSMLPNSATSVVSAAAVPEPTTFAMLGSMAVIFCLTGRFSARQCLV